MSMNTITCRFDDDTVDTLKEMAEQSGCAKSDVIRYAVELYILRNYMGDNECPIQSEESDFMAYDQLPAERKSEIQSYIARTYAHADVYSNATSYTMKHGRTQAEIGYLTNGQFKGAMLVAGYTPKAMNATNWVFKVKEKIPDSAGIHKFLCAKAKSGVGNIRVFAEDFVADGRTSGITTIKELVQFMYHVGQDHDQLNSSVRRIIREYGDLHTSDRKEFTDWVSTNGLYSKVSRFIPTQWRPCIGNTHAQCSLDILASELPAVVSIQDWLSNRPIV